MTGNGAVCDDVGVVLVASVIECGCNFNPEGEDSPDYLNRRSAGSERVQGWSELTSTLRINQCKRGRPELLEL